MLDYYLVLLILTRTSYACNAVGTLAEKKTQATLKYANTINSAIGYHRNRIHFLYHCTVHNCRVPSRCKWNSRYSGI